MDKPFAVIEQKTVEFYGDEIVAVRAKEGDIFVPVRPICELLGEGMEQMTIGTPAGPQSTRSAVRNFSTPAVERPHER